MKFSTSYKYDKLPASSSTIRLLDLHPSTNSTDEICITLRQVSLSTRPSYEALSWAWGDGKSMTDIQCDSTRFKITEGLETALRYLRPTQEAEGSKPRPLWIDAICINQRDTKEKEQQIRLMGEVYRNAFQVVAWIGVEKAEDSAALNIEKLQDVVIDPSVKEVAIDVENYITKLLQSMMAAVTLMRRPWFSRAWIIQEAALSKGLVLQCGTKIIRWSNFLALLTLLPLVTDKEGVQVYFGEVFLERAQFVAKIRADIRARAEEMHSPISAGGGSEINVWQELESLVSRGRAFGASNPYDHVFALLGLVSQKVTKLIAVDYSISHRVVYRDFTRMLIEATGSLTVLGQVDESHDEKLGSWVPDWNQPPMVDPLSSAKDPFYRATGNSQVQLSRTDNENTLALAGVVFDEIERVYPGPSSEASEALNWGQRRIAKGTQFGLSQSTPLLPYKSVGHLIPKAAAAQSAGIESEQAAATPQPRENIIKRKPVAPTSPTSTEDGSSIDGISMLSMQSTRTGTDLSETMAPISTVTTGGSTQARADNLSTLLARGIFTGLMRDPKVRQIHHIWGAIHPINGVYMQAYLQSAWRKALPDHLTYTTTGESMDNAYWRTLIGDKSTNLHMNSISPPDSWQHVFKVWHFMLEAKQGHVPRFAKDGPSKIFARAPLLASITSSSSGSIPTLASMQHQSLRDAFQGQNADRERLNRVSQLEVPAFRNILATLISVHNTYHQKLRLASSIPNNELIDLLTSYDDLGHYEKQRLLSALDALPTAPLSDDELKYQIDKAFWYDFVRVAKNRQFCVTKKGFIGWVPSAAEKGDKICLLMGGQVPYVVRRHKKPKGEWMFLGEAYVHGVMKGEVMSREGRVEEGWGKVETMKLR